MGSCRGQGELKAKINRARSVQPMSPRFGGIPATCWDGVVCRADPRTWSGRRPVDSPAGPAGRLRLKEGGFHDGPGAGLGGVQPPTFLFVAKFAGFGDGVDEADEVATDLLAEVVVLGGVGGV